MPRYRELRQAKDLQAKQVAELAGIDPTIYSKFENYRVLPTPADFLKVIDVLECLASDVYDPDEATLLPQINRVETTGGARSHQEKPDHYQMTVRLDNDSRDVLTKEILQKCGYKTLGHWIKACVGRLKSQYDIIVQAENKKPRQYRVNGTNGVGNEGRGIPLTNPTQPTNILTKSN